MRKLGGQKLEERSRALQEGENHILIEIGARTTRVNKADSKTNKKKRVCGFLEDDDLRLQIPAELFQPWFDGQIEQRVGTAKEHDAVFAGRRESSSHEIEVDPPARVF